MGIARGQTSAAEPPESASARFRFDLAPQSLDRALEAFGAVTGQSVIYDSRLTEGKTSRPVRGEYAARAALEALIDGTGLSARYTAANAVVLVKTAAAAAPPAASAQAMQRYRGLLQARVKDAFCANALLAVGDRRIAFRLWMDAMGRVEQADLLDSTGDRRVDAAVVDSLRSISVGESLPAGMAQPFTLLVMPRSSGQSWGCERPGDAAEGRPS